MNKLVQRPTKPEPPFAWQNKEALRLIREKCSEESALTHYYALYCLMSEFSSDNGGGNFKKPITDFMKGLGLGRRSVEKALNQLKALGLVGVEKNQRSDGGKDWSTYTLTPCALYAHTHAHLTDSNVKCASLRINAEETSVETGEESSARNDGQAIASPSGAGSSSDSEWEGLPECLNTPGFKAAWHEWVQDRKERKLNKLSVRGVKAKWSEMARWGERKAIESIGHSIRQSWQGLFPPKGQNRQVRPVPNRQATKWGMIGTEKMKKPLSAAKQAAVDRCKQLEARASIVTDEH